MLLVHAREDIWRVLAQTGHPKCRQSFLHMNIKERIFHELPLTFLLKMFAKYKNSLHEEQENFAHFVSLSTVVALHESPILSAWIAP